MYSGGRGVDLSGRPGILSRRLSNASKKQRFQVSNKYGPPEVTPAGNAGRAKHTTFTVHVRRWVRWWICVGVVCGAVALANIFFRHLTHTQELVILFLGVLFWVLGGLVCWAWEGVQIERVASAQEGQKNGEHVSAGAERKAEAHVWSRAGRQMGPPKSQSMRLLHEYLRRWEKQHNAS